jgi:peptidoglycan L-alanyl-D-glutamate endopeptidase CwlK
MSKFRFGKKSRGNLYGAVEGKTVRPELQALCEAVLAESPHDFCIVDGVRTHAEQVINVKKGFSRTMRSRHLTGHAIDFAPIKKVGGQWVPDWEAEQKFFVIAKLFCIVATRMKIKIVSGWRDWKWDYGHIQLDWKAYPAK